jgi:hypothetical protein
MIIIQCPNCSGVLTDQGIIWQCDDFHPEVLAQLGQQEAGTDEEENEDR